MSDHRFEILVLVAIFVFATIMLAIVKSDEMARWIEGGAIITVIARGMRGNPHVDTAVTPPTTPTPGNGELNASL